MIIIVDNVTTGHEEAAKEIEKDIDSLMRLVIVILLGMKVNCPTWCIIAHWEGLWIISMKSSPKIGGFSSFSETSTSRRSTAAWTILLLLWRNSMSVFFSVVSNIPHLCFGTRFKRFAQLQYPDGYWNSIAEDSRSYRTCCGTSWPPPWKIWQVRSHPNASQQL